MHNGSGVELWATAIGFLNKVLRIKAIPHRKLEMLAFFFVSFDNSKGLPS
jgi:hypothetical protein